MTLNDGSNRSIFHQLLTLDLIVSQFERFNYNCFKISFSMAKMNGILCSITSLIIQSLLKTCL